MSTNFAQFGLSEPLVAALAKRNITTPFPIQEEAIPHALAGRDIKGKAPTGSGKTLAFGLPVLHLVGRADRHRPRALILAPTRELAEQINSDLRPLAMVANRKVAAIYGGVGYGPQIGALRKGVDILVATPGRLEDLIEQGSIDLGDADLVVVDEADRMADMGFLPAVRRILSMTSPERHTMLFSATLDGDVSVLSRDFQNDPVLVESGAVDDSAVEATHHFWKVEHHDRVSYTADVIRATGRCIVFTRTRHGADRLAKQLGNIGVGAVAMHGGRSQGQRTRALKEFSSGRIQALIATDVAARGIHVDDVATVVHFDVPGDHKDYLHRSGRTARAGAEGTVVSLVTSAQIGGVRRMQRDLKMENPIGAPAIEDLNRSQPKSRPLPDQPQPEHKPRHLKPDTGGRPRKERNNGEAVSIYVGNLPWKTTEADLMDLFRTHGKVKNATVVTDRRTGRAKGYGFVDMTASDSARAVKAMQNTNFNGRPLKVKVAQD